MIRKVLWSLYWLFGGVIAVAHLATHTLAEDPMKFWLSVGLVAVILPCIMLEWLDR